MSVMDCATIRAASLRKNISSYLLITVEMQMKASRSVCLVWKHKRRQAVIASSWHAPCHVLLRQRDGVLGHHRFPGRRVRSDEHRVVSLQPQHRLLLEGVQLEGPLREQMRVIIRRQRREKNKPRVCNLWLWGHMWLSLVPAALTKNTGNEC